MLNLIQLNFLNNELKYYSTLYFPNDVKFSKLYIHSKKNFKTCDGKLTKYSFEVIKSGKKKYYSMKGLIGLGVNRSFKFYYDVSLKYARALRKGANPYNLLTMYEYIEESCDKRYYITTELITKGYIVPNIYIEYIEHLYNVKRNKELIPKYKMLNSVRNVFARKVYRKILNGYVFKEMELYIINLILDSNITHSMPNSTATLLNILSCWEMSNVEISIPYLINVLGYNILSNFNMEIILKMPCYVSHMSNPTVFLNVVDSCTMCRSKSNKIVDVYYDSSRLILEYIPYKFLKGYVLSSKGKEFTIEIIMFKSCLKVIGYINDIYYGINVNKNMPILYIIDERVIANYM